jgi:hypothetical protein
MQKYGRTPWTGDQPVARPLPTQDNTTLSGPRSEWNRCYVQGALRKAIIPCITRLIKR